VTGADIMVLATYGMNIVRQWCNRAIYISDRRINVCGPLANLLAGETRIYFENRNIFHPRVVFFVPLDHPSLRAYGPIWKIVERRQAA
jgi:hypothetical protein